MLIPLTLFFVDARRKLSAIEGNMKADKTCLIIYVNFSTGVSKEMNYFLQFFFSVLWDWGQGP